MTKNNLLKLQADCIPVKGSKNSIICDIGRKRFYPITNDLFDLLTNYEKYERAIIYAEYGKENEEVLDEYFEFLEDNEIIFWLNEQLFDNFPKLDLTWKSPYEITNAIIDLPEGIDTNKYLSEVLPKLESLSCLHIQIRAFHQLSIEFMLKGIVDTLMDSRIKSIEIISKFQAELDLTHLSEIIEKNNRFQSIVLYNSPFYKVEDGGKQDLEKLKVAYVKQDVADCKSCGIIQHNYFNPNIGLVTEAQKHNTCLNRKISIDVNGEIKNCPSMAKSYGNIKDTTLQEAIGKPGFKDMWYINKDQVSVCKDCEFRYICTDCRAYTENPEDIYSKPLKCGYNPYTAEWEEWSTNPLKQKAIEHYGMQELVKKKFLVNGE